MPDTPTRRSPIHQSLETKGAVWRLTGDMPMAVQFDRPQAEREAISTLGLCDLSALEKLGIKGRDAEVWLRDQGVDAPARVYESRRLADWGIVVRLAADEFLLESGIAGESVRALADRLVSHQGHVFRVERQEATFMLVGPRAIDVLAQTCGINFRDAPPNRLVLTRVAGADSGVLPDPLGNTPAFRIWIDYSYAVYLWTTLVEICESLRGRVVGAGCIFPELPP